MVTIDPTLPVHILVIYYVATLVAFILCSLSLIAIYRTKKTPYSTKLLSVGLLSFDMIFLVLAGISRLFSYGDTAILWHTTRGFQVAAQLIVVSMALERLFVINWPYVYLRVATSRLTKRICFGIFFLSLSQYAVVRGLACYSRKMVLKCGVFSGYLVALSVLLPAISLISYGRIYRIIRSNGRKMQKGYKLRQYKGTLAAFFVLINSTVTQTLCLLLSLMSVMRIASGTNGDGFTATLADSVNVVNCIVDPLIYVTWFKETRMEILKMIRICCPFVKPTVQKMRCEIFQIPTQSFYSTSLQILK